MAAVLSVGCAPRSSDADLALTELERLAFVPRGSCTFLARQGTSITCANDAPLLVDRFEVPRRAWLQYQTQLDGAQIDPILAERSATWTEDTLDWPATWMTLAEAKRFAARRAMRIPTAREWLRIAAGTRALPYPWGQTRASLVANTSELQLGRPVAVGTFELGATPLSTYDMIGNVWEWVDDSIAILPLGEGECAPLGWVLGGSFASPLRRLVDLADDGRLDVDRLDVDPETRGEDIGFRCIADAAEYLTQHSSQWGDDAHSRERLQAIGHAWGRDAVPLLEQLSQAPSAARGLAQLLAGARR